MTRPPGRAVSAYRRRCAPLEQTGWWGVSAGRVVTVAEPAFGGGPGSPLNKSRSGPTVLTKPQVSGSRVVGSGLFRGILGFCARWSRTGTGGERGAGTGSPSAVGTSDPSPSSPPGRQRQDPAEGSEQPRSPPWPAAPADPRSAGRPGHVGRLGGSMAGTLAVGGRSRRDTPTPRGWVSTRSHGRCPACCATALRG